jgi:hypothetical protein
MNQVILLGDVLSINKDDKEFSLSVPRSKFIYEGDVVNDILICKGDRILNKNVYSFVKENDKLLLKGRIQEDNGKYYVLVESYQVLQRKV